ncbi:unnamed protein product [Adineta steineri]|uniref:Uncharacterized protein n=1 Tax=Adineta steineri TaxID=433720 RepID=A0A818J910_9BILA|nr:unnamed protein product [Adineta steineri]CAF0925870.1 unnamed protein product [Adineta steineri]CAF3537300.1 unnamed protein product [Adineta steineri]CAF3669767.1 unnamed protein product [Adineta steineri]
MSSQARYNANSLSMSYDETSFQQEQKKEGLRTKLREKLIPIGKRGQDPQNRKSSVPDITNLTPQSQELILRAVDSIKKEDSESIMSTLDESRDILRSSFEEFKREQEEYRKQLQEISKVKEAAMGRQKENSIPLSIFLKQKRNNEGLADLRPNSSMNVTYQAYFEALLTTNKNEQQHPTDKAAVVKYIRRRERRKRAEENKKNHQLTDDVLEKQTAEIIEKMDGIDIKLENERQRQNDILRARMNEKKLKSNNMLQANEILGQANEADLARQRIEQAQRDKIEARLSAVRNQPVHSPINMIHVQSNINENDDETLNDEQVQTNKKSLQLLHNNNGYEQARSTTPVYGDDDRNHKVPNIHI